jgi:hypothetical protein
MRNDIAAGRGARLRTAALQFVVAVFGLASIVGSGGGAGFPDTICDTYPDSCAPPPPPPPALRVDPASVTVQVGSPVSFTAVVVHGTGTYSYQWQRSSDGGMTFANIPGANATTYSIASVNLADNGAVFLALAWQGDSAALQAKTHLAVSATPGIVFTDGEFVTADWTAQPAIVGGYPSFTHAEVQVAADGNPGAYRKMTVQVAPASSVSNVTHLSLASTYDPSVLGAIRVIDYAEDCMLFSASEFGYVESGAFIEQNGRRYLSDKSLNACSRAGWASAALRSLRQQDFYLFDGPACNVGESCPDFSATGAPLGFGYVRRSYGSQGETIQHGIDNWSVTVWRR